MTTKNLNPIMSESQRFLELTRTFNISQEFLTFSMLSELITTSFIPISLTAKFPILHTVSKNNLTTNSHITIALNLQPVARHPQLPKPINKPTHQQTTQQ